MALLGTVLLTLDHAAPAAVSANATPIAIGPLALARMAGTAQHLCSCIHFAEHLAMCGGTVPWQLGRQRGSRAQALCSLQA